MTSDSSHSSDKDWSPSPESSTYRQPPVMEIGIKRQNKPPVRLKSASVHPQAHIGIKCQEKPAVRLKRASLHPQAHIGIKCQEKPPVRLKSVSACTQPPRNMAKNSVSGVRPEEEPQGSIWFLTQAILLFPHPPAMDNSSQQEDRIPTSVNHASMCFRPSHAKIGIGCADKPPVRLQSSSRSTGWIESRSSWLITSESVNKSLDQV